MGRFDIVTVGSAVSDVFIKTGGDSSKIIKDGDHLDICYHIGCKVLINDIHFETGGGGTNTAVAFSRMGLKTGYVGKLGSDRNSDHMVDVLKKEKVAFLGSRGKGLMGFSVIMVGLQKDRTILTYKGLNNTLQTKEVSKKAYNAKRMYFSSMVGQSWKTAVEVARQATKRNIPYTFNPSLYLTRLGSWKLRHILKGCELLTLNKEEAETLTKTKSGTSVNVLLKKLHKFAPISVITDGKNGAYAYNGITRYSIAAPKVKVTETTGAGDAFASGITAGLQWHMDMDDCLKIGMAQSASVIQHVGAKNILLGKRTAIESVTKKCKIIRTKM